MLLLLYISKENWDLCKKYMCSVHVLGLGETCLERNEFPPSHVSSRCLSVSFIDH